MKKEELEHKRKKIKNQLLFLGILFLFFGIPQLFLTSLLKSIGTIAIFIDYGIILFLLVAVAIWYHKLEVINKKIDEWKD